MNMDPGLKAWLSAVAICAACITAVLAYVTGMPPAIAVIVASLALSAVIAVATLAYVMWRAGVRESLRIITRRSPR